MRPRTISRTAKTSCRPLVAATETAAVVAVAGMVPKKPNCWTAVMQPMALWTSEVKVQQSRKTTGTQSIQPLRPVHLQNTARVIMVMPPSSWLEAPKSGQMLA